METPAVPQHNRVCVPLNTRIRRFEPLHIISLGAGVQSSTMHLMAGDGEIQPKPHGSVFADTQAEPKAVYEWLTWLEANSSIPITRITKGNLTKNILTLRPRKDGKGYFAQDNIPAFTIHKETGKKGIIPRQCTYTYKVLALDQYARGMIGVEAMKAWRKKHYPALKVIGAYNSALRKWKREMKAKMGAERHNSRRKAIVEVQESPRPKFPFKEWAECQADPLCVTWLGISYDEVSRMKEPRHPWQNFRYPLIDMKMRREDCLRWMKDHGYPQPPRSACVYCPYHSNKEWLHLKNNDPEGWNEAVRVDYALREVKAKSYGMRSVPYLHASRIPLDQVDFGEAQGELSFQNECEGHCGV